MAAFFPLRSSAVAAAAAVAVAASASTSGAAAALSRRIAAAGPGAALALSSRPRAVAGSSSGSGGSWSRALATISDGAPPTADPATESASQAQAREASEAPEGSEEDIAAVQADVAAAVSEAASDAVAFAPLQEQLKDVGPIYAALVISRPPLLLREPSEFERAFFAYNTKLKSALAQPFPRDFYFKKGSTAEQRFDDAEARRLSALQDGNTDPLSFMPSSSASASASAQEGGAADKNPDAELYSTMPRITEADKQNDVQSLNRKLDRTLYLLTRKTSSATWELPTRQVTRSGAGKESLHLAARRAVESQLGDNMDVWLVSNLPIGVSKPSNANDARTYYMQAHVLSGNVDSDSLGDAAEFAWFTREEAEERLRTPTPDASSNIYWNQISDFFRP